jgi:hypothetical protein
MCDACENILTIFKHRLPRVLNDIIHEFSQTGRYCVQHQQCSICKNLVKFNSMRWFKLDKPILCKTHRVYKDKRHKYIKCLNKCWYNNCKKEGKYILQYHLGFYNTSCRKHEDDIEESL